MKKIIEKLKTLNIPIKDIEPATWEGDAAINLGGEYEGIHIQIAPYNRIPYGVVRELEDESFLFIKPTGNLVKDLKRAIEYVN